MLGVDQSPCIKFCLKYKIKYSSEVKIQTVVFGESTKKMYISSKSSSKKAKQLISEIAKFDQKNRRMNIGQEVFIDVNDDPDFLKMVISGEKHGEMVMML